MEAFATDTWIWVDAAEVFEEFSLCGVSFCCVGMSCLVDAFGLDAGDDEGDSAAEEDVSWFAVWSDAGCAGFGAVEDLRDVCVVEFELDGLRIHF